VRDGAMLCHGAPLCQDASAGALLLALAGRYCQPAGGITPRSKHRQLIAVHALGQAQEAPGCLQAWLVCLFELRRASPCASRLCSQPASSGCTRRDQACLRQLRGSSSRAGLRFRIAGGCPL
jgi:hypothetical protein